MKAIVAGSLTIVVSALFVLMTLPIAVLGSRFHVSDAAVAVRIRDMWPGRIFVSSRVFSEWIVGYPVITFKEVLGAESVFINIIGVASCLYILAVLVIVALVVALYFGIFGIFSGDWAVFGESFLTMIVIGFGAIILMVVGPFAYWLMMFFQPITPAYFLLWLFLGLPAVLMLYATTAGAGYTVVTAPSWILVKLK